MEIHLTGNIEALEQIPVKTFNVEQINSIAKKYKDLRQQSKAPTFALTYGGTYLTLMKNCGFSEAKAKAIEQAYHELYRESDEWVQDKIKKACDDGYITTGFGLRVRTPILKRTKYSQIQRNRMAAAEARTAGNALGQGWGVLNDRAMNEVMDEVDRLELSLDILPVAKVHDACYYLVKNDIETILTLNRLVTKAARWDKHPAIYHDTVKIHGQLDLFYPDWSNGITLPEDCSREALIELATKSKDEA